VCESVLRVCVGVFPSVFIRYMRAVLLTIKKVS
jgi:hypothetical protein